MGKPEDEWPDDLVPVPAEEWPDDLVPIEAPAPAPAGPVALRGGNTAGPEDASLVRELGRSTGAFVHGLGQGVTLGFGDEAAAYLGSRWADETPRAMSRGMATDVDTRSAYQRELELERQRLAAQKALAPSAFVAGEIGGNVAAGSTLLAPLAGVHKAVTTGNAGLGLLGARAALGGLEGAALGGVEGAGRAEGDVSRLEGAGTGAALGAGLGMALPAVGAVAKGLWEGGKSAVQGLGRGATRLVTANLPEGTQATLAELTALTPQGRAARSQLRSAEQGSDALARDIGEGLTAQREYLDVATNAAHTGLKQDAAARLLAEGGHAVPAQIDAQLSQPIQKVRLLLTEAMDDPASFPGQGKHGLKKLLEQVDAYAARIEDSLGSRTGYSDLHAGQSAVGPQQLAEAFDAADRIKRQVQRLAAGTKDRGLRAALEDASAPLRTSLEDTKLWGEGLGSAQRETNKAWREYLQRQDALNQRYMTDLGDLPVTGADPYADKLVGDYAKIGSVISGADRVGSDQALHVLEQGTRSSQNLVDTLGRMYDVPRVQELATRGRDVTQRLGQQIGQIREGARLRGAMGELAEHGIWGKGGIAAGIRLGGAAEQAAGRFADKAARALDSIEKLSPETVQGLQQAAARGPQQYAATLHVLAQQDPQLRESQRLLAEAEENPR